MSVYVMASSVGAIKIGIAQDTRARLSGVQTGSPYAIEVAYEIDLGQEDRRIERLAHKILADHRMNGEWFNVSVERAISAIQEAIATPKATRRKATLETAEWSKFLTPAEASELSKIEEKRARLADMNAEYRLIAERARLRKLTAERKANRKTP